MKFAFRFENARGEGPYNFGPLCHPHSDRRPNLHPPSGDYIFGFESEAQMQEWFDPCDIKLMQQHGFTLQRVPIKAGSEIGDGKQIAFLRDDYEDGSRK